MMNEKPSYYAIIPAEVRYDERLSANEKLMYGEITCLAHTTRECWASNKYFAELYGRRKETISVWVRNLISCGYVSSKLIYKDGSKEVEKRILTLPRLIETPSREKSNDPLTINRKDNSIKENSTSIIKDSDSLKILLDGVDAQRRPILDEWLAYKREMKKTYKPIGLKKLIKDWEGFSPNALQMAVDSSIKNGYSGCFPEKIEPKKVVRQVQGL